MTRQIATLGLALATIAGAVSAQSPPAGDTGVQAPYSVTVQNNRSVPVTIYLDWGSFDRRLGVVPALQTATLSLPVWAVTGRESVRLLAHPADGWGDLQSTELSLNPPARLVMLIPTTAEMAARATMATDTMMAVIPPDELADATLTVDNPRTTPVTVYAGKSQFEVRIGVVPPRSRATLRFPMTAIGPDNSIQIVVHPEGGRDLASETLEVRQAQHLGLRVPLR